MAGYALFCTLCSKSYCSRKEWNQHLIQDFHQKEARVELGRWRDKEKKRSLIVYSSGKLVSGGGLLEGIVRWLEENGGRASTFVGDLVLSPNGRDRVAVVQFESRTRVNRILSKVGGSFGTVEGGTVQVKQVEAMLELEWNEFLESFLGSDLFTPSPVDLQCQESHSIESAATPTSPVNRLGIGDAMTSVCLQFQNILQSVEIPREELDLVEKIMREMKQVLEETLPPCEVVLFRNNFLGLRNNPLSDAYLIFIYIIDEGRNNGFTRIQMDTGLPLLEHLQNCSDLIVSVDNSDEDVNLAMKLRSETGTRLFHPKSQVNLVYTTYPLIMGEYQLSRLVSYYCLFDIRVKSLLNIWYNWIKINKITLARGYISGSMAPLHLPDPVGLEWLLLFYLYHKEKLIPVPDEILQRPHHRLVAGFGVNLGCSFDPEFAANWQSSTNTAPAPEINSEEFVRSVLDIFWKFLVFYSKDLKVPSILVTRTGQVLTKENHKHKGKSCKLCNMLRDLHRRSNGKLRIFTMKHPIAIRHQFKISVNVNMWANKIRPAMEQTADKLEQFIENWKLGKQTGLMLEDVLKVVH